VSPFLGALFVYNIELMSYSINEIFYSLQGEGYHTGRPAIFCRFSHCNLWTGKEKDRESAQCTFCDTDFLGTQGQRGGRYDISSLIQVFESLWPTSNQKPYVIFTGGEPLLQVDEVLISELKTRGYELAVETNGTIEAPDGLDWICVSPKANCELKIIHGDELKLVYPQVENHPSDFENLDFDYFYLQPLDNGNQKTNIQMAIKYCLSHPQWQLSLQMQKILEID